MPYSFFQILKEKKKKMEINYIKKIDYQNNIYFILVINIINNNLFF